MTSGTITYQKKLILFIPLIFLFLLYFVIGETYYRNNIHEWIERIQSNVSSQENNDPALLESNTSEHQVKQKPPSAGDFAYVKKRLPSCLIIGSKKSGTGALRDFLDIHPRIVVAHGEPHFFDKDLKYKKGFEYYRNKMPLSYPDQITIEKSPSYLISQLAPKRIFEFNSKIKLIVILRHPVKRMISDFWHVRRMYGRDNLEFEELAFDNKTGKVNEAYPPVYVSLYYFHIKRYLEYFPRHQLHVVDGDNFIMNPVEEISKVETFLGLKHFVTKDLVFFDDDKKYFCFIKAGSKQCLKSEKGHTHPPIAEKHFKRLTDFFEPFNKKLFELIGQEFNWH